MINRNLTSFQILTTDRLTLRQLSTDDQQHIFDLRSDTEINKYLNRAPCETIEDAIIFINKINDQIQKNSIYWVITLTKTNEFVGTICLFDLSNKRNSCEIGYELMQEQQGKGIMKEALQEVINYAFRILQFKKILAFTHIKNGRSTKLLKKFNFVQSLETDTENPDLIIFTLPSID